MFLKLQMKPNFFLFLAYNIILLNTSYLLQMSNCLIILGLNTVWVNVLWLDDVKKLRDEVSLPPLPFPHT